MRADDQRSMRRARPQQALLPSGREVTNVTSGTNHPDLGTLTAIIARSQILIAAERSELRRLPAGFDHVDVAILDWIAAEGRRAGRWLVRM
jgi:hypothetical protein